MKKMKMRWFSLWMAMVLCLSLFTPVAAATDTVKISDESLTLVSGKTYQLSVTVGGVTVENSAWGSSDTSVATVDDKGLVTAKAAGSAVITAMVNGTTVECLVTVLKKTEKQTYRYNVLILDASGSMKGKPNTSQKAAAKKFCKKVLNTTGNNYVAVVVLNSSPTALCEFTNNYSSLSKYIDSITPNGDTNLNWALTQAGRLLNSISASGSNVMKNIVLCSDGLPTIGSTQSSGRYRAGDHKSYLYANAAYATASKLKKKNYFIYALGFFHNSTGNNLKFGKRLMKDLASKDKYYVIQDTKDLDDVFDDIADKITKVTMSKTSLTLVYGNTGKLNALVNGSSKSASWKSSDASVASVDQTGKVTAKKAGTTIITATIKGTSVTCKVTVKPKLRLNKKKVSISVGEKVLLKATVKGSKGSVTWKSSKPSIATVTQAGVVKGKKVGKTVISASLGGATVKCTVIVKKKTHPLYSMYFNFKATKKRNSQNTIDEEGLRLVLNDDAVIEKCGAYMVKINNEWYVTMAFKGKNITSATLSAYVAYKGNIVEDGITSSYMNKFSMSQDANGIWTVYGRYQKIRFNVVDTSGKNVATVATGTQSQNTKIFRNLEKMEKWLKK